MTDLITLFFQNLGIQIDTLSIREDGDNISIRIETSESPLLIGMHGKNLEALSHLLGRMLEKRRGQYTQVHLEVNDYIKSKESRFFAFLDTKIAWVTSSWKSTRIPNLSSHERKKAHDYVAEKKINGLATHSEGEGKDRTLCLTFHGTPSEIVPSILKKSAPETLWTSFDLPEDGIGI